MQQDVVLHTEVESGCTEGGLRTEVFAVDVLPDATTRHHADDVLDHANYNDEPDPAVRATVERLVDTSTIVELERIDPSTLPKKYGYRFAKRTFDVVGCSVALLVCAIPMAVIAL